MHTDILAVTWGQAAIAFLFAMICLLLILVILLQKGRGGGLSGAFGGGGGHSAFGAKTGDVFTWVTVALTFMFILMAVIGNYLYVPPPVTSPTATVLPINGGGPGGAKPAPAPAQPVQPEAPAPGN